MAAILGAVRGVDLVVEGGGGGILKDDVLVDATSLDVALVAQLSTAKPRGSAPVTGSDVEVVAVANDPNRHRFSHRAVASDGRDLQFLCPSDLVELVACPRRHRRVTLCNKQGFACDWSFCRFLPLSFTRTPLRPRTHSRRPWLDPPRPSGGGRLHGSDRVGTLGVEVSATGERVDTNVTHFHQGDEVFGVTNASLGISPTSRIGLRGRRFSRRDRKASN